MKDERKSHIWIWVLLSVVVLVVVPLYLFLALFYRNGYSYGTVIDGIYATGLTPQEVDERMTMRHSLIQFEIEVAEGDYEILTLDEEAYTVSYIEALQQIKDEQNPFLWFMNLLGAKEYHVEAVYAYDEAELRNRIDALPCFQLEQPEPGLTLQFDDESGYVLHDVTKGIFDAPLAYEKVMSAVYDSAQSISLTDCYYDLPETEETKALREEYAHIAAFQEFHFQYVLGEDTEEITPAIVAGWRLVDADGSYVRDANGGYVLDEAQVDAYVDALCDTYDTYECPRTYETHDGKIVHVDKSIYGNKIDREAEKAYLRNAYLTRSEEVREPIYLHKAPYQGRHDFGPDYIEVNLTQQHLYFILDNEVFIDTDIVSGHAKGHSSPEVCAFVQAKMEKRTLRGPGYASFVNYWCPVYKAVGLHDATWRNSFGGEIYLKNGSHGCINIPLEIMKQMYPKMYEGMPVIIFSEDKVEE